MKLASNSKSYKSPKHKLLNFFRTSRDKWKAKCLDAKATIKKLNNRIRFLDHSRQLWKDRAKEREAELVDLKARLREVETELEELKKKRSINPSA